MIVCTIFATFGFVSSATTNIRTPLLRSIILPSMTSFVLVLRANTLTSAGLGLSTPLAVKLTTST